MAVLTYDTNTFTNVKKWNVDKTGEYTYTGILVASKLNQKNGQGYKLLDAIDIDWNGAYVNSMGMYLNTTYDLIWALNILNTTDEVNDIIKQLEELKKKVGNIEISYVNHEELATTLLSYQHKLVAGANIQIDNETNVISTYNVVTHPDLYTALLAYTTNYEFTAFQNYISLNYYKIPETEEVAERAAYTAVHEIVDGADCAFDTLAEISDWILSVDGYEEITDMEFLMQQAELALKGEDHTTIYYKTITPGGWFEVSDYSNVTPLSYIYKWGSYTYTYTELDVIEKTVSEYNEETGLYEDVIKITYENIEKEGIAFGYIDISYEFNGTEYKRPYYKRVGVVSDLDELYKEVDKIKEEIGYTYYSDIMQGYSYTGMKLDIYQTQIKSELALNTAIYAVDKAEYAVETADTAYEVATNSYILSYNALLTSYTAIDLAEVAYTVAIKASYDVGVPTIEPGYELAYPATVINSIYDYWNNESNNIEIYYWNQALDSYTLINYTQFTYQYYDGNNLVTALDTDKFEDIINGKSTYYIYNEGQHASGLTYRVEEVEKRLDDVEDKLDDNEKLLYELNVDNTLSEYVKLGFIENEWPGYKSRTMTIQHDSAVFNTYDGTYDEGIVLLSTVADVISYEIGWDICRCVYSYLHGTADDPYRLETADEKYLELIKQLVK